MTIRDEHDEGARHTGAQVSRFVDRVAPAETPDEVTPAGQARMLKAILDSLTDGVIFADENGKFLFFNPSAERILGKRLTESRPEAWSTHFGLYLPDQITPFPPEDLPLTRALRGETVVDVEIYLRHNDASQGVWLRVNASPLHDETGALRGGVAIFGDATARKWTETELEQERYLLHTLLDNLPDSIYFKDLSSRFLRINRALAARFGLDDARDAVGKTDRDFFSEEHAWEARADEDRLIRLVTPLLTKEEKETWPDGHCTWASTTKLPLRDHDGRVVGTFGVSRDITPQKEAEEACEQLAAIVQSSDDAIVGTGLDGTVLSWNSGAERIYGYPASEILGRPVSVVVPEDRRDELHRIWTRIRWGEPVDHFETVRVRNDGTEVTVSLTISPIRDQNGEITGVSTIARDITEQKRAEAALRVAKDAAESASRAKSAFLANMSHEIRTPLNAVIGMTELVLDTPLTASQREYLNLVQESGESLLAVINDILDFSKIEAGKLDLEHVAFDLREVLGDTMKLLALRAHRKQVEIACQISPEIPQGVRGDPARLRQIVINLVGNAIKFTETGEIVLDVRASHRAGSDIELHFAVRDTGIGIAPEKQAAVFAPFEQADTSTTRKFGGTGLGLTISSRLVELMGGRIWLESEVGRGSTFHFTAQFEVAPDDALPDRPRMPRTLQGLPVLVVDDNATNRRILEVMLKNWGMSPTVVSGASAALAALRTARSRGEEFSLVLTDSQMPDVDGFHLTEEIREQGVLGSAVIMMLTSGDRPGDVERCERLGIASYLIKPIKQSELFDAIIAAVGSAAAQPDVLVPARPAVCRMRPLRVLLAEDSLVNQKLAIGLLTKWGHTVTLANTGVEALAQWESQPFDLILMDVQMPEMDGLETTTAIRRREAAGEGHIPIVAMTAHAMKGDRERCLEAGMDGYVSKPIRPQELEAALAAVCPGMNAVDDEAPAAGVQPGIDWPAALKTVQGDRDLLGVVSEAFLEEVPGVVADAVRFAKLRDATRLGQAAHRLRGALRTLGSVRTIERAAEIEARCKAQDVERAREELIALEPEVEAMLEEVRQFVQTRALPQSG